MPVTVWQAGQSSGENAQSLALIQQWWSRLQGQAILWQQRIFDPATPIDQLNWDQQRFDEELTLESAALRGVTLFWQKVGDTQERNLTATKLELDAIHQQLNIYSQAQANLVVRVTVPQLKLQIQKLINPELHYQQQGEQHILIARDVTQGIEVQIVMSSDQLSQLKQQI